VSEPASFGLPMLTPHARELDLCTYCPKLCRHACPVSNAEPRETFIPQQKMQTLGFLRRGQMPWDAELTASLYACTGCGHCRVYCAHDNDVAGALMAGRAAATSRGVGHAAFKDITTRFQARGAELAQKTREALPPQRLASEAKVGWMPGCEAIGDPSVVNATLRVLDRLGMQHVRVPLLRNPCGGEPLVAAGAVDALAVHDAALMDELRGFDLVLTSCAPCAKRLRSAHDEGRLRPAVAHVVEHLGPQADRLPVATRLPPTFYQDPCSLGRGLGVYDPPRRLLSHVVEALREPAWTREDAFCCGGGGGLPETMPDVAFEMARRRLSEVAMAGAQVLVTACSTCRQHLRTAADKMASGVRVLDVLEALDEAAEAAEAAGGEKT
jgi:Fe-S oxidoreductase